MSKKTVVGIDLGTSFTSIARLDSFGRPEVLPNAEGEQMTPSAVYFGDEGPVVGKEAMKSGSDDPERLIENAKRFMGTSFKGWNINGSDITPIDVSAHILRKIKGDAEEQIGPIGGAVISVPVHFSIQQRELTIRAAKRAGITVLGLVNEPVAGALTFILGEQGLAYAALADEQTILVYDLGGGTFDLSIVHYSEEGIDVKAATGDMKLGGIDWNQRLIDIIAQRFWDKRGYDIRRDVKMMRKLSENIEEAKRSLSNPKKPWTNVSIRYEGLGESFKITREEFEQVSVDLVERTKTLTDGLVRSTVRRWDLLNQVLPVGGATRMPMIREAIRQMCVKTMGEVFGLEPNYRLSPDLAIAQGAALYAGLLAGEGPAGTEWAKQTYVPKMVSSRGLGMAVRNREGERVNHILIPPGSRLPASVSVGVETIKDGQERISLKIVEAESEEYREEDVLLRCEINSLPPDLPEGSAFDVDLTFEPSGLLQIVARQREGGRIATARLVRDMASAGEIAESVDIMEQEVAPQDTEAEVSKIEGSKSVMEDLTRQELHVDETMQDTNAYDDPLFGEPPPETEAAAAPPEPEQPTLEPEPELPSFPTGIVLEKAEVSYESVESDPFSFDTAQAEPQIEPTPAIQPEEKTRIKESAPEPEPELIAEFDDPPEVELLPFDDVAGGTEPVVLELFEEEIITLESIDDLEPVNEPMPLDDGLDLLPLDDDPPPPPKPRKSSAPPKLTPLSKKKKKDEGPLPLD